jgi:CRP/FNR family cyclic AMP-dependent transcriptional regulator
MDVSHPTWVQLVGYVASLLVLSTFYMKALVPLRCVAIVSNVAFLTYGYLAGLYPVFFLHVVLLPLNVLRARRASKGDRAIEWMVPFMTKEEFKKADVLFRRGDKAAKFYYIESGSVRLPELGITLGPGEIVGEIRIFSPLKDRTATAVCETDVTALVLNDYKVLELYDQMPLRR